MAWAVSWMRSWVLIFNYFIRLSWHSCIFLVCSAHSIALFSCWYSFILFVRFICWNWLILSIRHTNWLAILFSSTLHNRTRSMSWQFLLYLCSSRTFKLYCLINLNILILMKCLVITNINMIEKIRCACYIKLLSKLLLKDFDNWWTSFWHFNICKRIILT